MKLKILTLIWLTISIGLLCADDDVYGAFQIKTSPRGAEISVYDTEQKLGTTPTEIFPVLMDDYMTQYDGIPGRVIEIIISKDGYVPRKEEIFVPLNKLTIKDAIRNPSVFNFRLKRTFLNSYRYHAFFQYSHHRPRHPQYFYPVYPPYNPPHYPHHNPPYNPPGGGNHGGSHGGSVNPPGGGGSHGSGTIPPGGGSHGGGTNPPGGGSHGGGTNLPGGGSHGGGNGNHSGVVMPPATPGGGNGGHVSPPNHGVEKPSSSTQGSVQLKPAVTEKPSEDEDEAQIRKNKTRK